MQELSRENWLLGEVLADPEKLFVLWTLKTQFCRRVEDFQKSYGTALPIENLVTELERAGFLKRTDDSLKLTEAGESAVSSLRGNKISLSFGEQFRRLNPSSATTEWRDPVQVYLLRQDHWQRLIGSVLLVALLAAAYWYLYLV